jgi:hypothetical protein
MEYGYVPVPIVEMMVKPQNCAHVQGCFTDEMKTDPGVDPSTVHHPKNKKPNLWWRGHENEMCPANEESGKDFKRVGTVYPYRNNAEPWADRTPYTVPLRAEVGDTLDDAVTCGASNGRVTRVDDAESSSTCYPGYVVPTFTMPPTPPPTKAPTPSCIGNCGESGGGGCWCDDGCSGNGDCCHDYVSQTRVLYSKLRALFAYTH